MWAVGTSASFAEAVLKAVNLGDDADSVGAVTGQIAGAIWGPFGYSRRVAAPASLARGHRGARHGGDRLVRRVFRMTQCSLEHMGG